MLGGGRLARLAALGVRSAGEGAFGALQEYAKSGGDEEKARAAGCYDFDTKPIELPRLLGKIEAQLQRPSPGQTSA